MCSNPFIRQTMLPGKVEDVFAFFQNAQNLERITPAWLRFQILTPSPVKIQRGTILDYRIRIHGVPVNWKTLIRDWEPPYRFVDVQLKGPYAEWIHEHRFEQQREQVIMTDTVQYRLPFGVLGKWVERLKVRKDIESIFDFREGVIHTELTGQGKWSI